MGIVCGGRCCRVRVVMAAAIFAVATLLLFASSASAISLTELKRIRKARSTRRKMSRNERRRRQAGVANNGLFSLMPERNLDSETDVESSNHKKVWVVPKDNSSCEAFAVLGQQSDSAAARADLRDTFEPNGGLVLNIVTEERGCSADRRAYAAGMAEGYITAHRVYDLYRNAHAMRDQSVVGTVIKFFGDQISEIRSTVDSTDSTDAYWDEMKNVLSQFDGLVAGYNLAMENESSKKLSAAELWMLNCDGDVGDYEAIARLHRLDSDDSLLESGESEDEVEHATARHAIRKKRSQLIHSKEALELVQKNDEDLWTMLLAQSKCTAMIKLLRDDQGHVKDVIFAHNAWTDYAEMVRIYKFMIFRFQVIDE